MSEIHDAVCDRCQRRERLDMALRNDATAYEFPKDWARIRWRAYRTATFKTYDLCYSCVSRAVKRPEEKQ